LDPDKSYSKWRGIYEANREVRGGGEGGLNDCTNSGGVCGKAEFGVTVGSATKSGCGKTKVIAVVTECVFSLSGQHEMEHCINPVSLLCSQFVGIAGEGEWRG
jgi:hypothetical protein